MDLTDPLQWNGYSYGENNPITYSDPTGEKSCSDDRCGAGADYVDANGDYVKVPGDNDGCGGHCGDDDWDKIRKERCRGRFCLGKPKDPVNHGPQDDDFVYNPDLKAGRVTS